VTNLSLKIDSFASSLKQSGVFGLGDIAVADSGVCEGVTTILPVFEAWSADRLCAAPMAAAEEMASFVLDELPVSDATMYELFDDLTAGFCAPEYDRIDLKVMAPRMCALSV